MLLKLNVDDDQDLRTFVKDLIRGQVESIVRKDLDKMISQCIEKYLPNLEITDRMRDKAITERVNVLIPLDVSKDIRTEIKEAVGRRIDGNFDEAIISAAREILRKSDLSVMIGQEVARRVKEFPITIQVSKS